MVSTMIVCPPDAPPAATGCAARTGKGLVPGLGRVTETYTFFISDCGGTFLLLETSVRLEVEGRGALQATLAQDDQYVP